MVRQGAQIAGSEEPNIVITGTPKAAAIWAGPRVVADEQHGSGYQIDLTVARRALRTMRKPPKAERSSVGPPIKTGSIPKLTL